MYQIQGAEDNCVHSTTFYLYHFYASLYPMAENHLLEIEDVFSHFFSEVSFCNITIVAW